MPMPVEMPLIKGGSSATETKISYGFHHLSSTWA